MSDWVPTKLKFFIGGFGPGWEAAWDGTKIVLRKGFFGEGDQIVHERVPTEAEWREFWEAVEKAGVWSWESEYVLPVLDGVDWSLEIVHDGKAIRSKGCNSYPGSDTPDFEQDGPFGIFLSHVTRLAAVPPYLY